MANVPEATTCAHCGRALAVQRGRGRQRRYCGPTCRSAARRHRNSFVKDDLTELARKATVDNVAGTPLDAVTDAQRHAQRADEALRAAVEDARAAGHTWQEIGDVLGTSRQAAFQRFGRPLDPRTGVPMATAIMPGAGDKALALLADMVHGDWTAAGRDFAPVMTEKLDAESLAESWARVAGMVGGYERTGEPLVRQLGAYTVVDVPLCFEAGELVGRISFNGDGLVSGLYFLRPEAAR